MSRNKYRLPKDLYMRTLWTIRDYDRLCGRREEILEASPAPPDGQPRGGAFKGGVEIKAMNLSDVDGQIKAIDKALGKVPREYRRGIWESIQLRRPFPVDAALNTYKMWKQRFVFYTAAYLGWL